MEDFLFRFTDSLVFEHTKHLFFFNGENRNNHDDNNGSNSSPILETPVPASNPNPNTNPNPNPPKKNPSFLKKFSSHIYQSLYSITIDYFYPDYKTLIVDILNHDRSLQSQLKYLAIFLLQELDKELDKDENKDQDLEFFIQRYRTLFADIEKTIENLEIQLEVLENKVKLDLRLMDLKLMDSSKKDSMKKLIKYINGYKSQLEAKRSKFLSLKKLCDSQVLGFKGIVNTDHDAKSNPTLSSRILHRFNLGNSSITLRFSTLARDVK